MGGGQQQGRWGWWGPGGSCRDEPDVFRLWTHKSFGVSFDTFNILIHRTSNDAVYTYMCYMCIMHISRDENFRNNRICNALRFACNSF